MKTAFIVMERTEGSKTWTVAYKDPQRIGRAKCPAVPALFMFGYQAQTFVTEVMSRRRGFWAGKPGQRKMESYVCRLHLPE